MFCSIQSGLMFRPPPVYEAKIFLVGLPPLLSGTTTPDPLMWGLLITSSLVPVPVAILNTLVMQLKLTLHVHLQGQRLMPVCMKDM